MNRARVWLVVSPVVAGGVLIAHALAYRLTTAPRDSFHAYLEHAPQVLLVLALAGLALAGFGRRCDVPPARAFPLVAFATFVVQEHLERIVHDGGVPILLTSRAFLVGLALQVPVAVLGWLLARRLLQALEERIPEPAIRSRVDLGVVSGPVAAVGAVGIRIRSGRGPPLPLVSR